VPDGPYLVYAAVGKAIGSMDDVVHVLEEWENNSDAQVRSPANHHGVWRRHLARRTHSDDGATILRNSIRSLCRWDERTSCRSDRTECDNELCGRDDCWRWGRAGNCGISGYAPLETSRQTRLTQYRLSTAKVPQSTFRPSAGKKVNRVPSNGPQQRDQLE